MLGTGGFSKVFLARDKLTAKYYALKIINWEFISKNRKEKLIKNELDILKSSKHPFIVSYQTAFKTVKLICIN